MGWPGFGRKAKTSVSAEADGRADGKADADALVAQQAEPQQSEPRVLQEQAKEEEEEEEKPPPARRRGSVVRAISQSLQAVGRRRKRKSKGKRKRRHTSGKEAKDKDEAGDDGARKGGEEGEKEGRASPASPAPPKAAPDTHGNNDDNENARDGEGVGEGQEQEQKSEAQEENKGEKQEEGKGEEKQPPEPPADPQQRDEAANSEGDPKHRREATHHELLSANNLPSVAVLVDLHAQLHELFGSLDRDASGQIDLGEFLQGARDNAALSSMLQVAGISEAALRDLFGRVDKDVNGGMDLDEFVDFFETSFLTETFHIINRSACGMMTRKEFRDAVQGNDGFAQLSRLACHPAKDVGLMYDKIDASGNANGLVSREEFIAFFKGHVRKLLHAQAGGALE